MNKVKVNLVSTTATTGWLDWIHGSLILAPNAVAYIKKNLIETVEGSNIPENGFTAQEIQIDFDQFVNGENPKNQYIKFDELGSYQLKAGYAQGKLELYMKDGSKKKFLFISIDQNAVPDAFQKAGISNKS